MNLTFSQSGHAVDEIVGFACSFSGKPSSTVEKVTAKLIDKDYNSIAKLLNSSNNAERYMAVITLEKLAQIGARQISEIKETAT